MTNARKKPSTSWRRKKTEPGMIQKKKKPVWEKSSKCCAGNHEFSKMHVCVLERLMSETDPATKEQIVQETIVHNDLLKIQIMLLKEAILAQSQKQN